MKKIAIQGTLGSYHDIAAHKYFEGEELTEDEIRGALRQGTIAGTIVPVLGTAVTLFYSILKFIQQSVEIKIKIQYKYIFQGNNLLY